MTMKTKHKSHTSKREAQKKRPEEVSEEEEAFNKQRQKEITKLKEEYKKGKLNLSSEKIAKGILEDLKFKD